MNERIKKLYKTVILKHNSQPFYFEKKEHATHVIKAYNQICGDRFELFFEMENGVIEDIYFHGFGCAISKASTSVLVKKLKGKNINEALELCNAFESITEIKEPDENVEMKIDDELEAFSAAKDFPGRLKCATLSWDEMKGFLRTVDGRR